MNDIKYYELKEISKMIRTPIPYLRKMIREHKLKGVFIGRHYIVSHNDLQEFINTLGIKNDR